MACRRRLRRHTDALRTLDDRMLRDIGLSRIDVECAVRSPGADWHRGPG